MSNNPIQPIHLVDASAATITAASLLGYLPKVAAAFAIIWYGVLLYDRFVTKKRK